MLIRVVSFSIAVGPTFFALFMLLLPPKNDLGVMGKGVWPCLRTKKKKQAKSVEIFHGRDQCKISRPLIFQIFFTTVTSPTKKNFPVVMAVILV